MYFVNSLMRKRFTTDNPIKMTNGWFNSNKPLCNIKEGTRFY